jgi:hypothetical protein
LFGSLGATGRGHGSDKAVVLGFKGLDPETVDTATADDQVAAAALDAELMIGGHHRVDFNWDEDVVLHRRKCHPAPFVLYPRSGAPAPGVARGGHVNPLGVGGLALAPVQDHVLVPVEVHPVGSGDHEFGVEGCGGHLVVCRGGVHGFRVQSFEAQDDGLVRAVAPPGGTERTEQLSLDTPGGAQVTVALEPIGEQLRSPHRADRV